MRDRNDKKYIVPFVISAVAFGFFASTSHVRADFGDVTAVPSGFTQFVEGAKQKIELTFTFGEKDTQKRLQFANDSLDAATDLAGLDGGDAHDAALDYLNTANDYLEDIADKQDTLSPETLQDINSHIQKKQDVISTVQARLGDKTNPRLGTIVDESDQIVDLFSTILDLQLIGADKLQMIQALLDAFGKQDVHKLDQDGDGLLDTEEKELGTSVIDSDTDGDGIDDGFELHNLGTDPLKFDTDGDGYGDSIEISNGFSPWAVGTTLGDSEVQDKVRNSYTGVDQNSVLNTHAVDFIGAFDFLQLGDSSGIFPFLIDLDLEEEE